MPSLDPEVIAYAEARIAVEVEEEARILKTQLERMNEFAVLGQFDSAAVLSRTVEICVGSLTRTADLIWRVVFRFVSTAGVTYSDTLASDLKAIVDKHLPVTIEQHVRVELSGPSGGVSAGLTELKSARHRALCRVATEIDLFARVLKNRTRTSKSAPVVMNIYSPVGAIQTGGGAIANVAQQSFADAKEQLTRTLRDITDVLQRVNAGVSREDCIDILEVADEVNAEINKSKPNIKKVTALLAGLATTIQTVSSLRPAYDTLKQILASCGVMLP